MTARSPRVAIVGAGMSGLCMAIKLKQAGIDTFTIYEKAGQLGGTWRDNTYPGLSCDVPSRFYQYSFALNPDWSHFFSPGAEIWAYLDRVADRYGIRPHIRFGTEVTSARFDDGCWLVETGDGQRAQYDFLVSATGVLHHPSYPKIDGLDSFAGPVFHSARWDHDVPVDGRRVAVVGTGSTGVQIVCGLAGTAAQLKLFQRTAQWILPIPNPPHSPLMRAARRLLPPLDLISYRATKAYFSVISTAVVKPGWQRELIARLCRLNLRTVRDPRLRRALTPDYQPMCKRIVISSGFYPAIQRDDVDLVTEGIGHIEPAGIVTRDGTLHEIDVLVLATGFDAHAYCRPMRLIGQDGLALDEAWNDGPRAYHTVALPGFPNFFMLMGPHSPFGNYPLTAIAENQADRVMHWIGRWGTGAITTVAPTQQATEKFNADMRAAMPNTVWTTGCQSWYLDKDGNPELWPWTPDKHQALMREITMNDYDVRFEPPTTGRKTNSSATVAASQPSCAADGGGAS